MRSTSGISHDAFILLMMNSTPARPIPAGAVTGESGSLVGRGVGRVVGMTVVVTVVVGLIVSVVGGRLETLM